MVREDAAHARTNRRNTLIDALAPACAAVTVLEQPHVHDLELVRFTSATRFGGSVVALVISSPANLVMRFAQLFCGLRNEVRFHLR
jgi:hypothetical protein